MSELMLAVAKEQLNVIHDEDDAKIQQIIDSCESAFVGYMKVTATSDLYVGGALPQHMLAALVLMAGELLEGRDPFSAAVVSLLSRDRDPTFA